MIENYSYGLNDQIGKGFSSKVFSGRDEKSHDPVAIKVLLKNIILFFIRLLIFKCLRVQFIINYYSLKLMHYRQLVTKT